MQVDDIVKYMPTSTVGKVVDVRNKDGSDWVKLDHTGLWYRVSTLSPCDPSEYKAVSVKYREMKTVDTKSFLKNKEDQADVDISEFSPTA